MNLLLTLLMVASALAGKHQNRQTFQNDQENTASSGSGAFDGNGNIGPNGFSFDGPPSVVAPIVAILPNGSSESSAPIVIDAGSVYTSSPSATTPSSNYDSVRSGTGATGGAGSTTPTSGGGSATGSVESATPAAAATSGANSGASGEAACSTPLPYTPGLPIPASAEGGYSSPLYKSHAPGKIAKHNRAARKVKHSNTRQELPMHVKASTHGRKMDSSPFMRKVKIGRNNREPNITALPISVINAFGGLINATLNLLPHIPGIPPFLIPALNGSAPSLSTLVSALTSRNKHSNRQSAAALATLATELPTIWSAVVDAFEGVINATLNWLPHIPGVPGIPMPAMGGGAPASLPALITAFTTRNKNSKRQAELGAIATELPTIWSDVVHAFEGLINATLDWLPHIPGAPAFPTPALGGAAPALPALARNKNSKRQADLATLATELPNIWSTVVDAFEGLISAWLPHIPGVPALPTPALGEGAPALPALAAALTPRHKNAKRQSTAHSTTMPTVTSTPKAGSKNETSSRRVHGNARKEKSHLKNKKNTKSQAGGRAHKKAQQMKKNHIKN